MQSSRRRGSYQEKGVYILCPEKRERRERRSKRVCSKAVKERIYSTFKLPQTTPVFFVEKKNSKKRMVQNYKYLNE